jgi:YegS/Rv2252/BmrU family lipid kinase
MKIAVIVNGRAGTSGSRLGPAAIAAHARDVLGREGAEPVILTTARPGHGRDLAREALEQGADVVCAWGGDGTVNEVASALVGTRGVLAVVPAGSGNGFARDLGIPLDADAALVLAVRGVTRRVDVGEVNGRPFFCTAGLGFDARIAHAFAEQPHDVRGFAMYLWTGLTSLLQFTPHHCRMVADGVRVVDAGVKLIAFANMRQWGNDAQVAPQARPDDGELDATVVEDRSTLLLLTQVWRLWFGTIGRAPGVSLHRFREATVEAAEPLPLHIDGEPAGFTNRVHVTIRPAALAVRVPPAARPGEATAQMPL